MGTSLGTGPSTAEPVQSLTVFNLTVTGTLYPSQGIASSASAPITIAASGATAAEKAQALLSNGIVTATTPAADINTLIASGGYFQLLGHFDMEARLDTNVSNLHLFGNGLTELDFSAVAGGSYLIYTNGGPTATTSNLASDAAAGDHHIHLAAGQGASYAAGDWIRIQSEATFQGTVKKGEFCQVDSVATDQINLVEPLIDAYATADTAKIYKMTFYTNQTFRDFSILAQNADEQLAGIRLEGVKTVAIERVKITDCHFCGVGIDEFIDVTIRDLQVIRANDVDSTGYGISVGAGQHLKVFGGIGRDCKHVVSCGGGTYVPTRFVTVVGMGGIDSPSDVPGFDVHAGAEQVKFIGCETVNRQLVSASGMHIIYQGCTCKNPTGRPGQVYATADDVLIDGCDFRDCADPIYHNPGELRVKVVNTKGENPKGLVTNPFDNDSPYAIGITDDVAVPTASRAYVVVGQDILITAANSANTDNAILVKDAAGNTVVGPVGTLSAQFVPCGWTINWGAFTGVAGAVSVWGL